MKVKSYNTKDLKTFNVLLQRDIKEGFKPTLALCFTDANLDFKSLVGHLVDHEIDVLGTTTCGEIFDSGTSEGSCSILLMDLNKDAYHIQLYPFDENEEETAVKIAEVAKNKFTNPSLITYASKIGANGDMIVRGYKKSLGAKTPIFGGLAGDNFVNKEFTVFHNKTFETAGLVALILDGERVKVQGKAYSGWEALGMTHVVTKAKGNVLYELDNGPALDLFIDYFGLNKSNLEVGQSSEMIPGIYPLKVIDSNDVDYLRSPLYYDWGNKSLILAGEIEQGSKVKFCPMPDIDTIHETVDFFRDYSVGTPNVDSVIINSCAARKMAFGLLMDKEIEDLYNLWKVPTVGFMALGEIGSHARENDCNFHNVTCSLLSLTEIKQ